MKKSILFTNVTSARIEGCKESIDVSRRRILGGLAAGVAAFSLVPAHAAETLLNTPESIVVLTAYPDEVLSRFEAAFEKVHPEYRLRFIWRMPHDALPYLQNSKQSGVDVYWSASPRTYAALAKQGALQKLDIDRSGLPGHLGGTLLSDPEGYYVATEMAGYGFAINPQVLERKKIAEPADWTDLAAPRFAGQIVLPSPAHVGFAPPLVEIVLQAYGWNKGWALWSEIAGNSVLIESGSTFVTDEVSSARRAVGVTIDFFAASALANGAPLRFIYPPNNGVNPAHIAITASATHTAGAKTFVEFVVSTQGQKILAHPDIRKLPVRPSVYAELPASQFNAFDAASKGGFAFNEEIAKPRMGLTTALFEQFLGAPHEELAVLWSRVHGAEAKGLPVAKVRLLLSAAPLSESESLDAALQQNFHDRIEGHTVNAVTNAENTWRARADKNRFEARRLLDAAGA